MKLSHKSSSLSIVLCVCYLPPENSSRYFDVNNFFDNLLSDIYKYQNEGIMYVCGDFNSRCGDLDDFIRGVDCIPDRDILDFNLNKYGEMLIDFLINTNMCFLNGRGKNNDFTSVSTNGRPVVDYCFVNHSNLNSFSNFSVTRSCEFINQSGSLHRVNPVGIPDHSLLKWNVSLGNMLDGSNKSTESHHSKEEFFKFDSSNISENFLNDDAFLFRVNEAIAQLESSLRTQSDIDGVYTDWYKILKDQMLKELPVIKRKNCQTNSLNSKNHRPSKPWWSDKLADLWSSVCGAEKQWLRSQCRSDKLKYKSKFVRVRKEFDKEVQRAKRSHWYSLQEEILDECNVDQSIFWKSIGKVGISQTNKNTIPMEVTLDDGSISVDVSDVLRKWRNDFHSLFNGSGQVTDNELSTSDVNTSSNMTDNVSNQQHQQIFNQHISIFEVKKAIDSAKRGKATGIDNITTEVVKNDIAVSFLHVLFNICFDNGIVPSDCGKCIINPIPKSSTTDRRDPLSYRGISLAPAMYKLYCSILNNRLSSWSDENHKLVDEQNGFRKRRSTTDHISSLVNIIDTRKKLKKSTFCAFIDFKKAYDTINRSMLWKKLTDTGISGKMFQAVKSLYTSVKSCVRVNSYKTEWFDVNCGLRQGCVLSPLLFNLFINDLAVFLKSLDLGVKIADENVCLMLYADDVVLLAESEADLQLLLNSLNDWCGRNDMTVNMAKSNVVHFRPKSLSKTDAMFSCGDGIISVADRYTYLGVVLSEHLDYNIMVKHVAQSASRALGLLIAKCKTIGGVPYNVFTKLYDSVVWPVISYSSSI